MQVARELHERVFAWMALSDERNLVASHVAGKLLYQRSPA
jgi:guanine deaminase